MDPQPFWLWLPAVSDVICQVQIQKSALWSPTDVYFKREGLPELPEEGKQIHCDALQPQSGL